MLPLADAAVPILAAWLTVAFLVGLLLVHARPNLRAVIAVIALLGISGVAGRRQQSGDELTRDVVASLRR